MSTSIFYLFHLFFPKLYYQSKTDVVLARWSRDCLTETDRLQMRFQMQLKNLSPRTGYCSEIVLYVRNALPDSKQLVLSRAYG